MTGSLTYAEWKVMEALWGKEPQTLSEVIASMGDTMDWSYTTYSSYLRKLCEKGFVGFEARGRYKFYYALVEEKQCIRVESRNILKKIGKGSKKALLVNMIEEGGLSPEDHADLQKLLDKLSKGSE